MSINPYQPPASTELGSPVVPDAGVSPAMLESLRLTRPRVSFIAWLGVVFGALSLLALFSDELSVGERIGVVIASVIYIFTSLLLRKYAKAIERALDSGRLADVELAIAAQATFWRVTGGFAIAGMLLLVGVFVLAFVAALLT